MKHRLSVSYQYLHIHTKLWRHRRERWNTYIYIKHSTDCFPCCPFTLSFTLSQQCVWVNRVLVWCVWTLFGLKQDCGMGEGYLHWQIDGPGTRLLHPAVMLHLPLPSCSTSLRPATSHQTIHSCLMPHADRLSYHFFVHLLQSVSLSALHTHIFLSLCPCPPLCVFIFLRVLRVGWCVCCNSSDPHCSTLLVHPKGTFHHGKRWMSECFVGVNCVIPPKAHQICVKKLVLLEETTPSPIKWCVRNLLCVWMQVCEETGFQWYCLLLCTPYGHF